MESLSEQRGPDAVRKQIVARIGFPEVPARSGGGREARAEPEASLGNSSALFQPHTQHTTSRGGCQCCLIGLLLALLLLESACQIEGCQRTGQGAVSPKVKRHEI